MKKLSEFVRHRVDAGAFAHTCDLAAVEALYTFYKAATIALYKSKPEQGDWEAMDRAGEVCEKLIGVPDEARK